MIPEPLRASLVQAAREAREHAYAGYSGYRVGAAVLTEEGLIFTGANVENAVYPLGLCAERVAVFKAVSEGYRAFRALVVVTPNGGAPCGSCRQVLWEFAPDALIIVADPQGRVHWEAPLRELLPRPFGAADLTNGR